MSNNKIDWDGKLLVVSDSGRECEAVVKPGSVKGDRRIFWETTTSAYSHSFFDNGMPYPGLSCWEVRNVAPKEVEWGPEIKVEGKRPEWLEPGQRILQHDSSGRMGDNGDGWYGLTLNFYGRDISEDEDMIRLPANHPHYTTPTRTALEQRMEDLVRAVADDAPGGRGQSRAEARAILAELEPVDPILLEARQVVADQYGNNVPHLREQALSGAGDEWFHTKVAIAALSRGRALERGE